MQMVNELGVSDRFVRLTHSQVYTIKKYISDRDGIELLDVMLSEQDRALFVEDCGTSPPPPGSQFQSFEVEELRNRLYPPQKEIKKIIPKFKPISAPVEPKRNVKLTALQQRKFDEMGLNVEKANILETFEGGKRPQHQVLIIRHNDQIIKISRRGKIMSMGENDE